MRPTLLEEDQHYPVGFTCGDSEGNTGKPCRVKFRGKYQEDSQTVVGRCKGMDNVELE